MNIVAVSFDMAKAVEVFIQKAKRFFYSVMLLGHRCPQCGGRLLMVAESRCQCTRCSGECDPTVLFERCLDCGGIPVLRVRRYQCGSCGRDIKSKFLFDGLVFNAEYFREKMAESRQRKQEQRERVRQMLAESRSADLPLEHADLSGVPGLLEALNALTAGFEESVAIESRDEFDLKRYESHIQVHIRDLPVSLTEIPALCENPRKDLVWRFIAVIFLAHAAIVDVWQDGQDIMVIKHEANRERCDVPGEPESSDGVERPMGRVEAW
jgi:hypothetical protein